MLTYWKHSGSSEMSTSELCALSFAWGSHRCPRVGYSQTVYIDKEEDSKFMLLPHWKLGRCYLDQSRSHVTMLALCCVFLCWKIWHSYKKIVEPSHSMSDVSCFLKNKLLGSLLYLVVIFISQFVPVAVFVQCTLWSSRFYIAKCQTYMSLSDSLALSNLLKESFHFIAFLFEYIDFPRPAKYMFH